MNMESCDLDLTIVVKEIKKFVLENYGKFPEYGDKVYMYAFHQWFLLLPTDLKLDIKYLDYFKYKVYPLIKSEMDVTEGEDYFFDTLSI